MAPRLLLKRLEQVTLGWTRSWKTTGAKRCSKLGRVRPELSSG